MTVKDVVSVSLHINCVFVFMSANGYSMQPCKDVLTSRLLSNQHSLI